MFDKDGRAWEPGMKQKQRNTPFNHFAFRMLKGVKKIKAEIYVYRDMNKTRIFLMLFLYGAFALQHRVMNTAIFSTLPQLKLHHIVLIDGAKDLYAVDFTPVNQSSPRTLMRLFLWENVPAEVRVKRLTNINIYMDDDTILQEWVSQSTCTTMKDKKMQDIVAELRLWESNITTMNLYTRNCQHFSSYAKTFLEIPDA